MPKARRKEGRIIARSQEKIEPEPFIYHGQIVPKPRMTRADRWKKRPCVVNYFNFKDRIRQQAERQNFTPGGSLVISFYLPMPESWSKKKKERMENQPHRVRPDIDNLIKSLLDALLKDDKHIWNVRAWKWWSYLPRIEVRNL